MISPLFDNVLESRPMIFSLIIINFLGFVFGVYYYMPQLDETPTHLWLLVIDCPLYVLLFSVILLFRLLKDSLPEILKFITCVGLFKYGLWTMLVLLLYYGFFFSVDPILSSFLFVSHLFMAIESFLVLRLFHPTVYSTIAVIFFFVLNDVSDYFFGTLPQIPETYVQQLFFVSVAVSLLYPFFVYRLHQLSAFNLRLP